MMIFKQTQVMIAFQIDGDRESDLINLLTTLVWIALAFFGFWQCLNQVGRQVKGFWQDCREAARIAGSDIAKLWRLDFSFNFGVG